MTVPHKDPDESYDYHRAYNKAYMAYERMYSMAEHAKHGRTFHPQWCRFCA